MKNNVQIRQESREILRGKWLAGVLITLVYFLIVGLLSAFQRSSENPSMFDSLLYFVVLVVIAFPMQVGYSMVWLRLVRTGEHPEIKTLFAAFNRRYHRSAMGTLLLMNIYNLLWTLLLIIPGIIKSLEYAMTPFIIADEPELGCNEAIEKSMAMMRGHRWQLFKMILGIIGWLILGLLTLGIAWLWIESFYMTALAKFYTERKAEMGE